ncbi:hypothetical protein ANME2D_03119 [Candidatus Methanoperedens nitroreducens]|uniref:Uncharacterized protein n=1 Tax=Candidatus Methanoperedens nitratireducens TaxID=1392998 RepID=A0A062V3A1_9EURY|nr:hypothetical protein [Candidatus Methanoperedens nitroreducens]KCZ71088.1 hypothetical protein ANME2D_03119 [Candidatus Methanoperedens nitroreducens]MDJ1421538.1 hypothetical protein [Candidatus Methanoperedens sp.]
MAKEDCKDTIHQKEVIYSSQLGRYIFYFLILITPFLIAFLWLDILREILLKMNVIFLNTNFLGQLFLILSMVLPIGILIMISKEITAKVIISTNGIEYSDIFTRVYCPWKNIIRIETINRTDRYIRFGDARLRTWNIYNISTWDNKFTLDGNFFWKDEILTYVYNKVISCAPNVQKVTKSIDTVTYDDSIVH